MQLTPNSMPGPGPARSSNPNNDARFSSGAFHLDSFLDYRDINVHAETIYVFNSPGDYDITLRMDPNSAQLFPQQQRNAFGGHMAQEHGQLGTGFNSGRGVQPPIVNGHGHGDPRIEVHFDAPANAPRNWTGMPSTPITGRNGFAPIPQAGQRQQAPLTPRPPRTSSSSSGIGSMSFDFDTSRTSSDGPGSIAHLYES